jgi:hypothetical protein
MTRSTESARAKVRRILSDGEWHTGLEIARRVGTSYATGVMAYVRKLRTELHGANTILAEYDPVASKKHERQVWRYRLVPKQTKKAG